MGDGPVVSAGERAAMAASLVSGRRGEVAVWGKERVRAGVDAWLDEQLGRCVDAAWAAGFHAAIGIGEPSAYLHRVIGVGGERVLCGIRFVGGDVERPFVEVLASTSAEAGRGVVSDEVLSAMVDAFASFGVATVRVLSACADEPRLGAGWTARVDQLVYAGAVAGLVDADDGGVGGLVELEDAEEGEALGFVASAYGAFAARRPELAAAVPAIDAAGLASAAASGRVAWWCVEGDRVGLIAVERGAWFGMAGWLVVEEVVSAAWSGRGTAWRAQRALARWIAARDPSGVLWGTIDGANRASLRAASRAGRGVVSSLWFVGRAG